VAQAHDLPFKDPADVLPTGLRGSKEP
jgi:hypothetical protein